MEVLSGRPLGKYNKKPRLPFHKMENLTIALAFIKSEGIPLVNIGTDDIFEGNMRIILGLIWLLILRYEIKSAIEEEDGSSNDLLEWIRSKIPEYNIKNFQSDWNDGRAICALVNALYPGLIPDHRSKDPEKAQENAAEGIDKADEYMKVDKLILPEEMTHPKVDKLAMMTYLAQFRNIKPGDIKRPQGAADFRAWGDGLSKGVSGAQSVFWVDGPEKLKNDGKLQITVTGPNGAVPVSLKTNDKNEIEAAYTPRSAGKYQIDIKYDGVNIPQAPFTAVVEPAAGQCRAWGDGLVTGIAGKESNFFVSVPPTDDKLEIRVEGPKDDAPVTVTKNDKGEYDVKYTPTTPGKYRVHVTLGGKHIPGSIFEFEVLPPASACRAYGPGLERAVVNEDAPFTLEVPKWVTDPVAIDVNGPIKPVLKTSKNSAGNYDCVYLPKEPGIYDVSITVGGVHVPGSVFKVQAVAPDASKCKAYGPGLVQGIATIPAEFCVDVPEDLRPKVDGKLAIKVEGPKDEAKVQVSKNKTGNYDVVYTPTTPGEYKVHVTVGGHHIPGSIFHVTVLPLASQCRAYGPGLEGGIAGLQSDFVVEVPKEIQGAVRGKLVVDVRDPKGGVVAARVAENSAGNYDVLYTPTVPGNHDVNIQVDGVHIPQSTFHVPVRHPADFVTARGPGLTTGTAGREAPFELDVPEKVRALLDGKLAIQISGPGDDPTPLRSEKAPGQHDVVYIPKNQGQYKLRITADGYDIPGSVFNPVIDAPDASRCRAYGDGLQEATAEENAYFTLETPLHVKEKEISIKISGPDRDPTCVIKRSEQQKPDCIVYDCRYLPKKEGEYKIPILVLGYDVPGSTFVVPVGPPPVRGRVRVYFSTTSCDVLTRSNIDHLENLFFIKKVHLRPDFEPWHAVDLMTKAEREAVFKEAGTRKLPIVFIDDVYIGGWEEIQDLNEAGELDKLLALHTVKLLTPEEHMRRLLGVNEEDWKSGGPRTHFCGTCGYTKLQDNRYCPECGSENPVPFTPDKVASRIRFHQVAEPEPTSSSSATPGRLPQKQTQAKKKEKETAEERRARLPKYKKEELKQDDFFVACYQGDMDKVEAMLIAGVDPNMLDEDGNTPWIAALENKQNQVGSLLVEYGANFAMEDFFIAIDDGHYELVEAMVKRGFDVNMVDEEGTSPLLLAIQTENGQIARLLRKHGALMHPPVKPKMGNPAFFNAIVTGEYDLVESMIKAGENLNLVDQDGKTALDLAVESRSPMLVSLLAMNGAQSAKELGYQSASSGGSGGSNGSGSSGSSPGVKKASSVPASTTTSSILANLPPPPPPPAAADPQQQIVNFFIAVYEGNVTAVKQALDSGIDVNCHDEDGNTPLQVAIESGQEAVEKLLRQRGAR